MAENLFDLTGKVALITGGNGGIGLGMATGLARSGADVVIWGRNATKNACAEHVLSSFGGRVLVQAVDASEEDAVAAGVADALSVMGRLDFVAANAGVGGAGESFDRLETDAWRRVLTINLDAVFWTFREACRHMVDRAQAGDIGGSLLATSSVAVINSPPHQQAYASSKTAVVGLVKSLAVEYGRMGIRVNALLPGFVRSDLSAHLQTMDRFNEKIIKGRVPMQRWGEPDDFGGLAVYLASDLSRFHTGDQFVIDGAYSIG